MGTEQPEAGEGGGEPVEGGSPVREPVGWERKGTDGWASLKRQCRHVARVFATPYPIGSRVTCTESDSAVVVLSRQPDYRAQSGLGGAPP
jgi:hypothetical protein